MCGNLYIIILIFLLSSNLLNGTEATFDEGTDLIPWPFFFFVLQISIERYPLIKIQERHWQGFFGAFP